MGMTHQFYTEMDSVMALQAVVSSLSSMHINTIYQYGYNHPRAAKLIYKYVSSNPSRKLIIHLSSKRFCRVLDAPKTGWRIRPGTLSASMESNGEG